MPPKTKISKEIIVNAAFEITKERGIEAVTAKAIARKVNCSIQPVYWVFETMDNVRYAVIEEAMKLYNKYLLTEVSNQPKYKSMGWNYIRFAKEQPQLFKLLYMSDREERKMIADSNLDDNKDYIISLIVNDYFLSKMQANDLYVKMWLFTHGIATMLITKTVLLSDSDISRMLTDVFMGILKDLKEKG